ncbi:acryloyl-CoA reductase [Marinicrinis lubricantis]|uniref:Acryloyl-CoA reductase n=1 Tax=Marinicrinis lubricantis TaxID=2086470 RepID=A0ABW1ILS1_9BACL
MPDRFRAFILRKQGETVTYEVEQVPFSMLPEGDVLIDVEYSSVNYKDGLAFQPHGKIVKSYPFIPGIDLSGIVVRSKDPRYRAGDRVLVTGYELGVSHFGGFSEYASVPGDWLVPLPQGFSLKSAMAIGTAGFTAALSIHRLEASGLSPSNGPVLVLGASGGVGSVAVAMLAKRGYEVVASTGKTSEHDLLHRIGAGEVISREAVLEDSKPGLGKQRWAGVVDPVGGRSLSAVLSCVQYGGSVATSGLTAGTEVSATVYPFILRGISLLGIDSVYCPMEQRLQVWDRIAGDLNPEESLDSITNVIRLEELPETLHQLMEGKHIGRTVVAVSSQ